MYKSGGVRTVVDYVLARKNNMKDVKVIPGEECVSQHKLVVMNMRIKRSTKTAKGTRGRLKTWRLRSATEKNFNVRWRKSWFMVKVPRRDGILWNMVSRMWQRKCGQFKGGKKCGGGMKRLRKLLRGKKRGIRNGGKAGVKRIWRCIKC